MELYPFLSWSKPHSVSALLPSYGKTIFQLPASCLRVWILLKGFNCKTCPKVWTKLAEIDFLASANYRKMDLIDVYWIYRDTLFWDHKLQYLDNLHRGTPTQTFSTFNKCSQQNHLRALEMWWKNVQSRVLSIDISNFLEELKSIEVIQSGENQQHKLCWPQQYFVKCLQRDEEISL